MNIKNLHRILQNNPSLNIFWYNSGDILKTCWHVTYITIRQVPVSEPARTFWKHVGMSAASPSDKAQCQQNQVLNLISWIFSDPLSSLPLDIRCIQKYISFRWPVEFASPTSTSASRDYLLNRDQICRVREVGGAERNRPLRWYWWVFDDIGLVQSFRPRDGLKVVTIWL